MELKIDSNNVQEISHFGVVRDWVIILQNEDRIEISSDIINVILEHENERHEDKAEKDKQTLAGYFQSTGSLQKLIRGSIQDFVNRHPGGVAAGNTDRVNRLAQRITCALKGFMLNDKSR